MPRPGPRGCLYQPLSKSQIHEIHEASLAILANTGIAVEHPEARLLYQQAGARIEGNRVYIPAELVNRALQTAPSRVLLAARDPAQDVVLEGDRVYAGTGGSPTSVLPPGADQVRAATIQDLVDMARLADSLENCDFIVVPIHPTDVPEEDVPPNRFYACLSYSNKHVMGGVGSVAGAEAVIQMASAIAGGLEALQARPIVSAITSWMVSPLHLDTPVTDILLKWCRHGLPVVLSSAPMAGSTSPITLAGTLVQLNAEQLSGLVLTQLANPGTPVLLGYIPGVSDMRSGGYVGGAIEFGMMQAGAAQLAHFHRVPIYCSGGMTDAKLPDVQAGYEKMGTLLLAAMAGCNYIHHAIGMLSNMSAVSLEQAVIDDEIVGMVMRVLRGVQVSPHTMAGEAIARVGPGGHYLLDPHTLEHMRSEYFYPVVADRQNRSAWEASGKATARERAIQRVQKLLGQHRPPGLPPSIDREIRAKFNIRL